MKELVVLVVLSVTDGDTIKAEISGTPYAIRIEAIDTPEIRGKCPRETRLGYEAKGYVRGALAAGRVELATRWETGRYGRLLGDVLVNGQDLGAQLIAEGLAQKWPNTGNIWCD